MKAGVRRGTKRRPRSKEPVRPVQTVHAARAAGGAANTGNSCSSREYCGGYQQRWDQVGKTTTLGSTVQLEGWTGGLVIEWAVGLL